MEVFENDLMKNFEELYRLFRYIYTKVDYILDRIDDETIRYLFENNPDVDFRKNIEADEEGYVTIYRGVGSKSKDIEEAYSWTLNIGTAHFFANRFSDNGRIFKGKVHINNIKDYFTNRNESEVIVFSEDIIDIEEITNFKPISFKEVKSIDQVWNVYKRNIKNIKSNYYFEPQGIHGVSHTKRVLLLALTIGYYEKLSNEDMNVLIICSLLHDIGRINDEEDLNHGALSVKKL